jgi:pyruvate dehydrogenase E2 component (dihydrolipoamide acetyltransferase)
MTSTSPARAASASAPSTPSLRGRTQKMVGLRKIIAQRMVESLRVPAQLTSVVEVDLTEIAELRKRTKADFEVREGVKLSFLPFLVKAALEGLQEHPKVNATIDPTSAEITYHDAEHLGVAVDTEKGLFVPVIRDAGRMGIAELSRQIAEVAARTRSGKLKPEEMAGGTFTITNTGSRGALFDTPIINQPQVAILGTGAVVRRPAVVRSAAGEENIEIRSMAYLALSYDHRLVDGADAARYLSSMKTRLETADFAAEVGG